MPPTASSARPGYSEACACATLARDAKDFVQGIRYVPVMTVPVAADRNPHLGESLK
jgi:hypothetical protein